MNEYPQGVQVSQEQGTENWDKIHAPSSVKYFHTAGKRFPFQQASKISQTEPWLLVQGYMENMGDGQAEDNSGQSLEKRI